MGADITVEILKDIRTKKALDDDLTNRLKAAITAFQKMFQPNNG